MSYGKVFELTWPGDLGPNWMNIDNLELCLYSEEHVRRDLLQAREAERSTDSVAREECDSMMEETARKASPEKVPGLVCYGLLADIKRELEDMEKQLEPVLRPSFPTNEEVKEVSTSPAITALQQILSRVKDISGRISL